VPLMRSALQDFSPAVRFAAGAFYWDSSVLQNKPILKNSAQSERPTVLKLKKDGTCGLVNRMFVKFGDYQTLQ
jgi:hypothetical protein